MRLVPTTREIYIRASLYRAEFNLKTPDAIHIASAVASNAEIFMTNDRKLRAPKGLQVVHLG